MTLALRYPISFFVIVFALLATAAVFTVARPRFRPAIEIETVDLSKPPHHSVSDVRSAFAGEGIRLTSAGHDSISATTTLGLGPLPWDDSDLWVTVFPQKGVLGIGHGEWEKSIFEQRLGNVLVHYGGTDADLLEQVKRAVTTLRPVVPPRGAGFLGG